MLYIQYSYTLHTIRHHNTKNTHLVDRSRVPTHPGNKILWLFTLIVFFFLTKQLISYRWDLFNSNKVSHDLKVHHWFLHYMYKTTTKLRTKCPDFSPIPFYILRFPTKNYFPDFFLTPQKSVLPDFSPDCGNCIGTNVKQHGH